MLLEVAVQAGLRLLELTGLRRGYIHLGTGAHVQCLGKDRKGAGHPARRDYGHTLRHTAAKRLLHAGVDTSVIALWFGHERAETTQIYLNADLAIKERALVRTVPINACSGRYRPSGPLFAASSPAL